MAITKSPTRQVLYYQDNTTTLDLSDDVVSIEISSKGYNRVHTADILLKNKAAYYGEGTGGETEAYIRYNHDIKITLNDIQEFYGIVTEKILRGKNRILIRCASYEIILKRMPVRCMNRYKVETNIYDILTDSTVSGILYDVKDSGVMDSGTKNRLTLNIVSNGYTTQNYPLFKFGRSFTCFDALVYLADMTGHYFYIEKTVVAGSTVLTLYFKSKNSGTVNITATYGVNIIENNLNRTENEKIDRLVVYGNTTTGVIAVAQSSVSLDSSSNCKPIYADDIVDDTIAQSLADIQFSKDSIQKYIGNIRLLIDGSEYPVVDGTITVTDTNRFNLTAQVLYIANIDIYYGDGYYYVITVSENDFNMSEYTRQKEKDLKSLKEFREDPTATIEPCPTLTKETLTLAENIYLDCAPCPEAADWTSPNAGEIQVVWETADEWRTYESGGSTDTFTKYEILADNTTPPSTVRQTSTTEGDTSLLATGLGADTYYCVLKTTFGKTTVSSSEQTVVVA